MRVSEGTREPNGGDEGQDVTHRLRLQAGSNLRLHVPGRRDDGDGERTRRDRRSARQDPGSFAQIAERLQGQPQGTVRRKSNEGESSDEQRVPVGDAGLPGGAEMGEQRLEEPPVRLERNAAHHAAQGRTQEKRQQTARDREDDVPERLPHRRIVEVVAELQGDAAPHEEPQDDHQWQEEPAEARGVEDGKGEHEDAADGDQPHLVAVPERADGPEDRRTLGLVAADDEMADPDAEVEAVEDHVDDDHGGQGGEPERGHKGSGPCSISRATRNR